MGFQQIRGGLPVVGECEQAQEDFRQANADLSKIVTARTAELAAAIAGLAAANQELESFAYSVSHDLRAPLRAIDGFSRILLEDYADKLDSEGQRLLNVVRDNTLKIGRLIDGILILSRVGRAAMQPVPVDMAGLARDALAGELAPALAERQMAVEIGTLPWAHGDKALLQRVWLNLLDNAIKFTAVKPAARIEVSATNLPGETRYCVRDNGVGFDMQQADRLFGVFQRLHGAEYPGIGVGLAIVKKIVTRHGGRVWAEGKAGEGAMFSFTLPNAAGNAQTGGPDGASA